MKDRSTYQDLINEIEVNYPVNEWMHNKYKIWPIIRIRLFLMMIRQFGGDRHGSKRGNLIEDIYKQILNLPSAWIDYLKLDKSIGTLYCGAENHRVNYQGYQYNRYFDHLMDKEPVDCLLMERNSNSKKNYYKPDRVLLFSNLLRSFRPDIKLPDLFGIENKFAKEISSLLKEKNFEVINFVAQTTHHINSVDRSVHFFTNILEKTSPEKIYELCYYSTDMLGLNIAADKLGIPTIDVQHGPQGSNHLAYGSWQAVPQEGYEALPNEFHTWDESSANSIQKWAKNTKKHSAIVTGNPWVEAWKNGEFVASNYSWPDNLILYTLQPTGNPLEPYLLETIKRTCDTWDWWLRLHPRQLGELDGLKKILYEFGIIGNVNISDATELPLPEILINTKVHLTKFSGCAIEAFNFRTPTIILDKRGENIYKDYFEDEIMSKSTEKNSNKLISNIKNHINDRDKTIQ